MVKIFKILQPSATELGREILTQVRCTVEGCSRIFQHSSALHMHLVKVHKIIENDKDLQLYSTNSCKGGSGHKKDILIHYHCPVENCKYQTETKFFTTYSNLRQHYLKVHAEKQFKCSLCEAGFGMERLLRRHATKCNPLFKCSACSRQFPDKATLRKHCEATSHPFLFNTSSESGVSPKEKCKSEACDPELLPFQDLRHKSPRTENRITHEITQIEQANDRLLTNILTSKIQSKTCVLPHQSDSENIVLHRAQLDDMTRSIETTQRMNLTAKSVQTTERDRRSGQFMTTKGTFQSLMKSKCSATATNQSKSDKGKKLRETSSTEFPVQSALRSKDLTTTSQMKAVATETLEKVPNVNKLPTLKPKLPQSLFFISPSFGGNVTVINQNITVTAKQRAIAPKPGTSCEKCSSYTARPQLNHKRIVQSETIPKTATKRESSGTQTVVARKRVRGMAAQTQTTGDYILKKAMRSAKLPIIKQSKGSQVSPRAKLKQKTSLQTIHAQTQVGSPRAYNRRVALVSNSSLCEKADASLSMEAQTSEENNRFPIAAMRTNTGTQGNQIAMETQTSELENVIQKQTTKRGDQISIATIETQTDEQESQIPIVAIETQTIAPSIVPCVIGISASESVKPVESISTQTAHSYQTKHLGTQDSQMQTKLSMNMSLASCDSMDLQCLEQLGITSDTVISDEIPTCRRIDMEPNQPMCSSVSLSGNLFTGNGESLRAMALADTAINKKLAELESSGTSTECLQTNFPVARQTSQAAGELFSNVSVQTATDHLQDCSEVLSTAEMQVQTSVEDFDFPCFLSTEAQTTNFDQLYSNSIETQTAAEGVFDDLLSHMETQTNTDDMSWMDLGFTDIHTQTGDVPILSPLAAVNAQTQTNVDTNPQRGLRQSVEIQANMCFANANSDLENVASSDIQTQTFFDMNLTDSHTQTSWNDLLKIVTELN